MRRRSTTPAEDLFHTASRLPWWGSVLIAAGAWLALQPHHQQPTGRNPNPHVFSSLVTGQAFCAFGKLGQFLPPIFLIGAVVSVIGCIRRRRLQEDVANTAQPGVFDYPGCDESCLATNGQKLPMTTWTRVG